MAGMAGWQEEVEEADLELELEVEAEMEKEREEKESADERAAEAMGAATAAVEEARQRQDAVARAAAAAAEGGEEEGRRMEESATGAEAAAAAERRRAEGRFGKAPAGQGNLYDDTMEARRLEAEARQRREVQRQKGDERRRRARAEEQQRSGAEGRLRKALAEAAAARRAAGRAQEVTAEEAAAEAEEQERRDAEEERRKEEATAGEEAAEAAAMVEAAAKERARREAAKEGERRRAQEAAEEALAAAAAEKREDRRERKRVREEKAYASVQYFEEMTAAAQAAIERSPALMVCVRRREYEQEEPSAVTETGVAIGMEPVERKKMDVGATKRVAAMALAIEKAYGTEYVYAVDGSSDETEQKEAGEVCEKAAAWGSWDGKEARGGGLPPGTDNMVAELVAIERTLARHGAGDRVLLMCDCSSAIESVERAWRCGELGPLSTATGRTGGLVVEAIVRHMLRIAGQGAEWSGAAQAGDGGRVLQRDGGQEAQRHGCCCYMWVKAHGGGIVPNVYADAIAKSHLAEAPEDVPLASMLPRLCVYAVAVEGGGERAWELAADRSLRRLVAGRLTANERQRMRRESRTGGASARLVEQGVDRKLLAAMLRTDARPAGAKVGAAPERGRAAPTRTGMAMRLRADDMHVGGGGEGRCWLCGQEGVGGAHVLRCEWVRKGKERAQAMAEELAAAAEETVCVELRAPATEAAEEWAAGGVATAVAALGAPPEARAEHASVEAWAAAGWRTDEETYEMCTEEGADDLRKVAWCAVAVGTADAWAKRQAKEAARTAVGAAAAGVRAAHTALHWAAVAVGQVSVEGGEPRVDEVGEGENGVARVRMRYRQLRRVAAGGTAKEGMRLEEWERLYGGWLRKAREKGAPGGGWSVHTRRGFRRGTGAAHRKEVETMAVAPDGRVYAVAQPGTWPWQVEYEVHVQCGAHEQVMVRLRLQRGREGEVVIGVAAWPTGRDGRPTRMATAPYQQVDAPLSERGIGEAARALFWTHGWAGAARPRTGARAVLEDAARAAAAAAEGREADWECIRRALSGELPQQTVAERAVERKEREERAREAEAARHWADAAAVAAEAARARAWQAGGRPGEGRREGAEGAEGDGSKAGGEGANKEAGMLLAAAAQLGVKVDAGRQEVRRQYLRQALQNHPDKGGDATQFRAVQAAYEVMSRTAPEERRRVAGQQGGGDRPGGGAATAAPEMADAEEAQRAEEEAAEAGEEERRAAGVAAGAEEAAARPRAWERVAARLEGAVAAYSAAWSEHQSRQRKAKEEAARKAGYATHGARRATEAAERKERAREERVAAEAAAVREGREREKKVMGRMTAARRREEVEMRELSGARIIEAMDADWAAVQREYSVLVPWAAFCAPPQRCTCPGGRARCKHKNSRQAVEYVLESSEGSGAGRMVYLVRRAASEREQKAAQGWDYIPMTMEELTGRWRYGADGEAGVEMVLRGEEEESEDSEEEVDQERREVQRLLRETRRRMREAREASEAADAAARTQRESGPAEEDWQREAAEDGLEERQQDGEAGGEGAEVGGGLTAESTAAAAGSGGAGRWSAWAGAYLGPVAAAEYAVSMGGRGPEERRASPRTKGARAAAANRARRAAEALGRAAALGAAKDALRRGGMVQLAIAAGETARREEGEARQIVEAAAEWRTRSGQAPVGWSTALGDLARRAADRMQREAPAATAEARSGRARVASAVVQLMGVVGGRGEGRGVGGWGRVSEEVARELRLPEEEGVRRQLRAAVEAVAKERDEGRDGDGKEEEGGGGAGSAAGGGKGDGEGREVVVAAIVNIGKHSPPCWPAAGTGGLVTAMEGRTLNVLCNRRASLGNPWELPHESLRDTVCEECAVVHAGTRGGGIDVDDFKTRAARLRKAGVTCWSKWERDPAAAARKADAALGALVVMSNSGKYDRMKLWCHCAPKRCHAEGIIGELEARGARVRREGQVAGGAAHVAAGGRGRAATRPTPPPPPTRRAPPPRAPPSPPPPPRPGADGSASSTEQQRQKRRTQHEAAPQGEPGVQHFMRREGDVAAAGGSAMQRREARFAAWQSAPAPPLYLRFTAASDAACGAPGRCAVCDRSG